MPNNTQQEHLCLHNSTFRGRHTATAMPSRTCVVNMPAGWQVHNSVCKALVQALLNLTCCGAAALLPDPQSDSSASALLPAPSAIVRTSEGDTCIIMMMATDVVLCSHTFLAKDRRGCLRLLQVFCFLASALLPVKCHTMLDSFCKTSCPL